MSKPINNTSIRTISKSTAKKVDSTGIKPNSGIANSAKPGSSQRAQSILKAQANSFNFNAPGRSYNTAKFKADSANESAAFQSMINGHQSRQNMPGASKPITKEQMQELGKAMGEFGANLAKQLKSEKSSKNSDIKPETNKSEAPKSEAPKQEVPKAEVPKAEVKDGQQFA